MPIASVLAAAVPAAISYFGSRDIAGRMGRGAEESVALAREQSEFEKERYRAWQAQYGGLEAAMGQLGKLSASGKLPEYLYGRYTENVPSQYASAKEALAQDITKRGVTTSPNVAQEAGRQIELSKIRALMGARRASQEGAYDIATRIMSGARGAPGAAGPSAGSYEAMQKALQQRTEAGAMGAAANLQALSSLVGAGFNALDYWSNTSTSSKPSYSVPATARRWPSGTAGTRWRTGAEMRPYA